MRDTELLQEGLALMGLGMGFVFVFLTVLVVSVTLMSKLVGRFQPTVAVTPDGGKGLKAATNNRPGDEVVAVISAAVHRHRASRRL